jgi:hypothetical protein
MPGVHVVHFCPMCLTARNGLRHPKRPTYYVPHEPHEVLRVVLAGRAAMAWRADKDECLNENARKHRWFVLPK